MKFRDIFGAEEAGIRRYSNDDKPKRAEIAPFERVRITLVTQGVKELNFTVYGLAEYQDRFAGRKGDFELILRMMAAARNAGLYFTVGVPLTGGNIEQTDMVVNVLKAAGCGKIRSLCRSHSSHSC